MPRVADFITFQDTQFILSLVFPGDSADRTVFESIPDVPQFGEGALLTWNALRQANFSNVEGNVTYQVRVNGNFVASQTETVTDWHMAQEIIPTNTVQQGDNNVEFRVTLPSGRLFVSDVVLWYRKDI